MSGLAPPDAGPMETIASFALPLAAGAAAAVHPAGARGLAGLTSAVQNQLAVREFGQREKTEQATTMRLSQLLDKDTGEQMPTGRQVPDFTNISPPPAGAPPEAPPIGSAPGTQEMPTTPEMRAQKVSDVLGRGPTELVRALLAGPGNSREVAGILAGQLAPKPHWQLVDDIDPATKQPIKVWRNLGTTPSGTVVARGLAVPSLTDTVRDVRAADEAAAGGGAQPQPQPATVPRDIPSPPAGEPPPAPPIESAPLATTPAAPTQGAFRPRSQISVTQELGKQPRITVGPGTVTTHLQKGMNTDGTEWLYAIPTDQSGRRGAPEPVMQAPAGDSLQAIQRQVMGLLPNLQFGSKEFNDAVNAFSLIGGTPEQIALGRQLLQEQFGVQLGAPQSSAPQPGAQPGQAGAPPQGAVTPTPQGVRVAQTPRAPMGPLAQQAEANRIATEQKAKETSAITAARENTDYAVKQGQRIGSVLAGEMQTPGGGEVLPTWTVKEAADRGARKVNPTPPADMKTFEDLLLSRAKLEEMKRLIPEVDLKNLVGSIRPWANQVAQTHKAGPIPIPADLAPTLTDAQNRFLTLAADYADAVVRIRTGAALPDKEYVRLLGFLLSPSIEPGAFVSRLNLQQDILRATHENWEKLLDSGGYRVPHVPVPSIAPRSAGEPGVPPPPVFQQKGYSVGAPVGR